MEGYKTKLSSGPRDLWALLIPLHIDYQATTFGHQYSFWVVHPIWAWHLNTEHSSTERTAMSVLQQVLKEASRQRPLPDQRAFSLSDSSIFLSLFVSPSGWQNAFFPTAALVLQYVLNQANRQKLLLGLRPEDLPVLRYWGVTLWRLFMFLKLSERSLRTTKRKKNVTTWV